MTDRERFDALEAQIEKLQHEQREVGCRISLAEAKFAKGDIVKRQYREGRWQVVTIVRCITGVPVYNVARILTSGKLGSVYRVAQSQLTPAQDEVPTPVTELHRITSLARLRELLAVPGVVVRTWSGWGGGSSASAHVPGRDISIRINANIVRAARDKGLLRIVKNDWREAEYVAAEAVRP